MESSPGDALAYDEADTAESNRRAATRAATDEDLVRQVSQITFVDVLLAAQERAARGGPYLRLTRRS